MKKILLLLLILFTMGMIWWPFNRVLAETVVTIHTRGGPVSYQAEVADDVASVMKGLMFRKSMPDDHGMWFDFGETREIKMWMKNTYIPLDMLFVNEQGIIRHIHMGAVPESTEVISSQTPVRFVLEINAGQVRAHEIEIGDRVEWRVPTSESD